MMCVCICIHTNAHLPSDLLAYIQNTRFIQTTTAMSQTWQGSYSSLFPSSNKEKQLLHSKLLLLQEAKKQCTTCTFQYKLFGRWSSFNQISEFKDNADGCQTELPLIRRANNHQDSRKDRKQHKHGKHSLKKSYLKLSSESYSTLQTT